jgi:hypothetical protein
MYKYLLDSILPVNLRYDLELTLAGFTFCDMPVHTRRPRKDFQEVADSPQQVHPALYVAIHSRVSGQRTFQGTPFWLLRLRNSHVYEGTYAEEFPPIAVSTTR